MLGSLSKESPTNLVYLHVSNVPKSALARSIRLRMSSPDRSVNAASNGVRPCGVAVITFQAVGYTRA